MTSTYMCGFSNRNRSVVFTPMGFRPCFWSSGRSRTRSRRSMVGGNSSRPCCLLPAGLAPRLQTLEQFPIACFVRLGLGGDNLLLFRTGRLDQARRRSPTAADRETRCDARYAVPTACPSAGCWRLPVPPPAGEARPARSVMIRVASTNAS